MLSVIIVSWNVRDLLRECLHSLERARADVPSRIIVVESASSDGSAEMLRAEFPTVELVARTDNIGYVKGNNLALRMLGFDDTGAANDLQPEFVWLLNPDTVIKPGCARMLLAFMRVHTRCGLCAPMLLNPDGTLQHGSFEFPGLMQLLIDTQPRLARLRNSQLDGRYSSAAYATGAPFRIGHPLGAGMLARGRAIRQIGLLDENFAMYCEEVDWAARMARAGWERWCVPAAELVHVGGASSSQASHRSQQLLWASRRRYYTKHYGVLKREIALRIARRPAASAS